jgi:hypothetical protein
MSKRPTKRQMEAEKEQELLSFLTERAAEIQGKAQQKHARAFTAEIARDELFLQAAEQIANELFSKFPIKTPQYVLKNKKAQVERAVNVVISDTHFHSFLSEDEVLHAYGPVEEARRLARVTLEIGEYKPQYRDNTVLHLQWDGDMIAGMLKHDPRIGAPLAAQVMACEHLLIQQVVFLSRHYRHTTVHCTPGNHGRNIARHQGVAYHQKWDSIETMIYNSVRNACRNLKNVVFDIPKTPFFIYDVFGHNIMGTHGDTVINFGNVGQTLNIASINQQMSEFNDGLRRDGKGEVDVICGGHVHWATRTPLPCGVTLIVNPSLTPSDGFAVGIGKIKPINAATLFESVKGHPAGDYRLLEVDSSTDKDKSLDKIISPFTEY